MLGNFWHRRLCCQSIHIVRFFRVKNNQIKTQNGGFSVKAQNITSRAMSFVLTKTINDPDAGESAICVLSCSRICFTCSRIQKPRTSPFQPLIDKRFIIIIQNITHLSFPIPQKMTPSDLLPVYLITLALVASYFNCRLFRFRHQRKRNNVSGLYTHMEGLAIALATVCILDVGVRICKGLTVFRILMVSSRISLQL